jgi:CHAT domain-containing protein/tetratricopeptide (TPR) repeat protein
VADPLTEKDNMARQSFVAGRFSEALRLWQECENEAQRRRDPVAAAGCKRNIGEALLELGCLQDAVVALAQARKMFVDCNRKVEAAHCEKDEGVALKDLGHPQQAKIRFELAKEVFQHFGYEKEAADNEMNIGAALADLGDLVEAEKHYAAAEEKYGRTGYQKGVADCAFNLGAALLSNNRSSEALAQYERAKAEYGRLQLRVDVAECELGIGEAFDAQRYYGKAIAKYEQARQVFLECRVERRVADSDVRIGGSLAALGRYEEAIARYENAQRIFSRRELTREAAFVDSKIGNALYKWGNVSGMGQATSRYTRALININRAIETFERLRASISIVGLRISFSDQYAHAYCTAINCCLKLGRLIDALNYLERSRSKSLTEMVAGDLLPDRHEIGEALYDRFLDLRRRLRKLNLVPPLETMRTPLGERGEPASERLIYSPDQHEFAVFVQRIAARFPKSTFTRRVRAARVSYLSGVEEYISLLPDEQAALLEFLPWSEDEGLRAFLLTKRNQLELLTFPKESFYEICGLLKRWSVMYEKSKISVRMETVLDACYLLHQVIFSATVEIVREQMPNKTPVKEPLISHLDELLKSGSDKNANGDHLSRRLYVIPYAGLFLLPLHAACAGARKQPHYLASDYTFIYAPSAFLLRECQRRQYPQPVETPAPFTGWQPLGLSVFFNRVGNYVKSKLRGRPHSGRQFRSQLNQIRALVVGNPLPRPTSLAAAEKEAKWVSRELLRAGAQIDELIGQQATKQCFLYGNTQTGVAGIYKGDYDHIHLAQHAEASRHGRHAWLEFGIGSENILPDQYRCYAQEIVGATLHKARCVVAAACETGVTDPMSSDYYGITSAFLQAGAGTVISTIYPLSDIGSTPLMRKLYLLRFRKGLSWSEAMRQAQLKTIRPGAAERMLELLKIMPQRALWHPYHWAAFTVNGKG